ncbi:MAG: Maf family protein [Bacteroidetes bacterium]|nr:Maf family protein [Bacteroidota bacterium]
MGDAGFEFSIISPDVDESFAEDVDVDSVPLMLANRKMEKAKTLCQPNDIIITADTVVILENKIIGKPIDRNDAVAILKALSGKQHKVVSGVCIAQGERQYDLEVTTRVYFDTLTDAEVDFYIDKYQPYDKAGAYAIQEWIGINKITRIEGDYYNVVGFPMSKIFPVLSALTT